MPAPTQQRPILAATAAFPIVTGPPVEPLPQTLVSDRASARPVVAPVTFPGYEILGELGRGGMGVVYKARQRSLNRLVALKVVLGGPLASSEDKARFRIEAEAAARLHHPNIVQVYDVGEHVGFSYMALELVEGSTLRAWQDGQPIEARTAAQLVATLARAVHHAHEQGIVHRDIKPANVLLSRVEDGAQTDDTESFLCFDSRSAASPSDLVPKITDFGLAKALIDGADLTLTGVACGTPNYMAPEQVRGKPPGPGMDVYGLGGLLYELLTGQPPFTGTNPSEVMGQIVTAEPVSVRQLVPSVPRDLAVIVAKCLEKQPGRRYLTALAVADDLDRFLTRAPIAARPIGPCERAWRWARRNPVVAAFLAVSTVGCAITGGLAAALAKSASDERAARSNAESALAEAERERKAAAAAEEASAAAAKRALKNQQEADATRARAENNLRVAREVIRGSMRELTSHPRFEEEDFRGTRLKLIEQVRRFRDTVAAQAPNTPEWLDDLSDVSFFLGYLEYVNHNNAVAGVEYKAAADAAGRWAKLEPRNTGARARQGYSLVNAGNALTNARRFRDAEACYRAACELIDGVVKEAPDDLNYRHQAVESYRNFANLYRTEGGNEGEWFRLSVLEAERAEALLRANTAKKDNLPGVATAQLSLAMKLGKIRKWDEADGHFAGAVAVRARMRDAAPGAIVPVFEYAAAVLAHAEMLAARGQGERAEEAFAKATAAVEKVQAALPNADEPATQLAAATSRYADFLHSQKRLADAERAYERSIELSRAVVQRSPWFRPGWEALTNASIGRAHLYNGTDRHREAAVEWARLAVEDPNPRRRPGHELFVCQSLLFAHDWKAASAAADAWTKKASADWMAMDFARIWCLVARDIDSDAALEPADKLAESGVALGKAVAWLERARAFGEFNAPERVRWFNTSPDFAPARGRFDPTKK